MIHQGQRNILALTFLLLQTFFMHGMGPWRIWAACPDKRSPYYLGYINNNGWLDSGSPSDIDIARQMCERWEQERLQKKEERMTIMLQVRRGMLDKNSIIHVLPLNVLDHIHQMLKEIYESM